MKIAIFVWALFYLRTIRGISDGEASFLIALKASTNVESVAIGWTQPVEYYCNYTGVFCSDEGTINRIDLNDNKITGFIPPEIGNLTNTYFITLIGEFTGQIPSEIGQLSQLQQLALNGELSGPIPSTIGNLAALIYLSMNGNELNGSIPQELRFLYNLRKLDLSKNTLIGEVPLFESGLLDDLNCDLSFNQLCYSDSLPGDKRCQVFVSCSSVTTAPSSTADPTTAFVTTASGLEEGDDDGPDCPPGDCDSLPIGTIIGLIVGGIVLVICCSAVVISLLVFSVRVMRKRRNKTQDLMIVETPYSVAMEKYEK